MRLRRLTVPVAWIVELSKGKGPRLVRVVSHPLPDDATVVRIGIDPLSGAVHLVIESAAFPDDVNECDAVPALPSPLFEVVYSAEPARSEAPAS